jgi:metallo-beta-lactamase family protein
VILSASRLATGERVQQHLAKHLAKLSPDPHNPVVFGGFQIGGSRGARLLAGDREIKIHGQCVPVRAPVSAREGVSGHADAGEWLAWRRQLPGATRQTFVVHGKPDIATARALRLRIKHRLGWNVWPPQQLETGKLQAFVRATANGPQRPAGRTIRPA